LFHIEPEKDVNFPLQLRIPQWCQTPSIRINGEPAAQPEPGKFAIVDRIWKKGDQVELILPMVVKLSRWENNSAGVERGPLVYALAIQEDWKAQPDWRRNQVKDNFPAYEIMPASAWNYGLVLDTAQAAKTFSITTRSPIPLQPWSPENVPVYITARGKKIPSWQLDEVDDTQPLPLSPVLNNEKEEMLRLIPFGATRLRIAYIPVVE
jgi:hypothetical protein